MLVSGQDESGELDQLQSNLNALWFQGMLGDTYSVLGVSVSVQCAACMLFYMGRLPKRLLAVLRFLTDKLTVYMLKAQKCSKTQDVEQASRTLF